MKKFVVFDIDGTLIRWQLYHAIVDALVRLGFIAPVKFQAIRDARMIWKRRESSESFHEYEMGLVKQYQQILSEITVEQFDQAAQAVFEEYKDQVYVYTRDLLKKLKAQGYLLFAISGSQIQIISRMAAYYGFDDYVAKVDEHRDNRFTGKSKSPIFAKDKALASLAKKHGASFEGSIGVGDSVSDIKMLEMVKNPIAFNPEKALFEHAQKQGWKIVVERKNMVYELESENGQYKLAKTNA